MNVTFLLSDCRTYLVKDKAAIQPAALCRYPGTGTPRSAWKCSWRTRTPVTVVALVMISVRQ